LYNDFGCSDDESVALILLQSGKFEITENDSVNLLEACRQKQIEVVKVLIGHPSININVKDRDGRSAFSFSYPDTKLARLLLETGKIDLDQDKAVQNLAQSESGTIQFEFRNWLITMNSENSVQSIINTNTLFPSNNLRSPFRML
jgi:ankyrin repeat protein